MSLPAVSPDCPQMHLLSTLALLRSVGRVTPVGHSPSSRPSSELPLHLFQAELSLYGQREAGSSFT